MRVGHPFPHLFYFAAFGKRRAGSPRLDQNSPVIFPSSVTSILTAAGTFGSPGMVIISPESATTNPAPALTLTLRMVSVKPSGAPSFFGSSEKEYCV